MVQTPNVETAEDLIAVPAQLVWLGIRMRSVARRQLSVKRILTAPSLQNALNPTVNQFAVMFANRLLVARTQNVIPKITKLYVSVKVATRVILQMF